MANRSSRKRSGKRTTRQNNPELRTASGSAQKRAERREKRASERARNTSNDDVSLPVVGARGDSLAGLLAYTVIAWLLVGLVVGIAMYFGRWWSIGWPDSLWLFLALGGFAVTIPAAATARRRGDVGAWTFEFTIVALVALAVEGFVGPRCIAGSSNCGAYGALGAYGPYMSVAIVVVAGIAALFVGRRRVDAVLLSRPERFRTTKSALTMTWAKWTVFGVLPIALAGIVVDSLLRPEPKYARQAQAEVALRCFDLLDKEPSLVTRPDPVARGNVRTAFVVGRTNEARKNADGKKTVVIKVQRDVATPYEAQVGFKDNGLVAYVDCRRVHPGSGQMTPLDTTETPLDRTTLPNIVEDPFKQEDAEPGAPGVPAPSAAGDVPFTTTTSGG